VTFEGAQHVREWVATTTTGRAFKNALDDMCGPVPYIEMKTDGGSKKFQLFYITKPLAESLEEFDLAPCRIAIGARGAFCTPEALHAFSTGECRDSCCVSAERRQKYKERGFQTDDLPEAIEGRLTFTEPDYERAWMKMRMYIF